MPVLMRGRDYRYHLEMMLITLYKCKFPSIAGDTRNYLNIDMDERKILMRLIKEELDKDESHCDQVLYEK